MSIYNAIMNAAYWIESHPKQFNFDSVDIPSPSCGSPGCALGWIGYFAGGLEMHTVSQKILKLRYDYEFYTRMRDLNPTEEYWARNPDVCAITLRLYAAKYHPEVSGIPDSVRAIFREHA